MTHKYFLLGVLFVCCTLLFSSGFTSPFTEPDIFEDRSVVIRTPEEALRYDAIWYAEHFSVSLEEAVRRLSMQTSIGELYATLIEKEKDSFAGLWVTHSPEYRIHIALTNEGEANLTPYIENSGLSEIVCNQKTTTV